MQQAKQDIMFGDKGQTVFFGESAAGGGMKGGMAPSDKSGPQGQGLETMDQGWVTFTGNYDRNRANVHIKDANQNRSVYGSPSEENFNILHGDILFTWIRGAPKRGLWVMSSLNGAGKFAASLFPDNPEMQREALKSEIKVIGTARDEKPFKNYSGPGQPENLAVQVLGTDDQIAVVNTPPGAPLMYELPNPETVRNGEKIQKPGEDGHRATLQLVPFKPASVERTIRTHMVEQIFNNQQWGAAMNEKARTTMAWKSFGHAWRSHAAACFLLYLEGFTSGDNPILTVKFNPGNYDLSEDQTSASRTAMTQRQIQLGLARYLGLIPNSKEQIPNVISSKNKKDKYDILFRDLSARVFSDGRVAQFGSGYKNGVNPGIGENRKIRTGTADGEFLFLQLNHWLKVSSGMHTALNSMYDFYAGTCMYGASVGEGMTTLKKR